MPAFIQPCRKSTWKSCLEVFNQGEMRAPLPLKTVPRCISGCILSTEFNTSRLWPEFGFCRINIWLDLENSTIIVHHKDVQHTTRLGKILPLLFIIRTSLDPLDRTLCYCRPYSTGLWRTNKLWIEEIDSRMFSQGEDFRYGYGLIRLSSSSLDSSSARRASRLSQVRLKPVKSSSGGYTSPLELNEWSCYGS